MLSSSNVAGDASSRRVATSACVARIDTMLTALATVDADRSTVATARARCRTVNLSGISMDLAPRRG